MGRKQIELTFYTLFTLSFVAFKLKPIRTKMERETRLTSTFCRSKERRIKFGWTKGLVVHGCNNLLKYFLYLPWQAFIDEKVFL